MKKHTSLKSKFNSAFSLVELLVVIAVIAVIAAIAIPNITNTQQAARNAQESMDAATIQNLQKQAAALGAAEPTEAQLRAGYPVSVTNAATGVVSTVTFKLE